MIQYKNSFYRSEQHRNNPYIREVITAYSTPESHNGYEIYKQTNNEFHIVKDGVCLSMVGSLRYAKTHIDCGLDHAETTKQFKILYPKN